MSIEGLVHLVIYLIILGVILGLLVYLVDISPIIEPWKGWLRWVVIAVAVIILILLLLRLVGGGGLPRVHLGAYDTDRDTYMHKQVMMPPAPSIIRRE